VLSLATGGVASSPSEYEIQQRIRLACGHGPVRHWRNNASALVDQRGRLRCPWDEPRDPPPAAAAGGPYPGEAGQTLGLHPGPGSAQWHLENVEATVTGWSRRHLQR
jgi:hypothetical protein